MGTFAADLDLLIQAIQTVSSTKNYWLIRTQSGSLYETFIDNNYISLGHKEVSIEFLKAQRNVYKTNESLVIKEIR